MKNLQAKVTIIPVMKVAYFLWRQYDSHYDQH